MAGRNKTPLIGWHPADPELVEWLEAEVERRGGDRGTRSVILDEALSEYRASCARHARPPSRVSPDTQAPEARTLPARNGHDPAGTGQEDG